MKEAGSTSSHDVHAENPDWMVVEMSTREWLYHTYNMLECVCTDILREVREVGVAPSQISEHG